MGLPGASTGSASGAWDSEPLTRVFLAQNEAVAVPTGCFADKELENCWANSGSIFDRKINQGAPFNNKFNIKKEKLAMNKHTMQPHHQTSTNTNH